MADDDRTEFSKAIGAIIAHAWADDDFRKELTKSGNNLQSVLAKKGLKLPSIPNSPNAKLTFVANEADQRYIVIPIKPELTDDDVGLFIKLRQLETDCTDCFSDRRGTLTHIVDEVKKILGLENKED